MVTQQPSGIVAFLFTDVENSTAMWDQLGGDMASRLEAHDQIMRRIIESHGGYVFSTAGDSFAAAFSSATNALEAGFQIQLALDTSEDVDQIRVRMGIHSGEASIRDGDYFGPSVNRAARIMSLGHGGQILVSATASSLIGDSLTEVQLTELGTHSLAGFESPERIFQADPASGPVEFPPLRSTSAVANNLPEQPTPFIGRDVELAEIGQLMESSRVVT
ncbi:MAG: adenylate/guanylate cyclase domain-containing protein, partial [Acidimicrobiia bacterium]